MFAYRQRIVNRKITDIIFVYEEQQTHYKYIKMNITKDRYLGYS